MDQQSIIIVNPYCHQHRGWKRWLSIKEDVLKSMPGPVNELVLEKGINFNTTLTGLLKPEERYCLISAGGDGSMHYLVNAILQSRVIREENIVLGAIGLGSSNDFLKPFGKRINGIPVRINLSGTKKNYDVGLATYYNNIGEYRIVFFVVNASIGVTATANWSFNHPGKLLHFLQGSSTALAITYTAISTILHHQNISCTIVYDDVTLTAAVSNINILKIPFVSGSFWYKQDITPDDGKLGMHICRDMNQIDLLRVLSQLSKGQFREGKKTMSRMIRSFRLTAPQHVIFECDGETDLANDISIRVLPAALKFLTS